MNSKTETYNVKVTVAGRTRYTLTFLYSDLDMMQLSDDEKMIIMTLYHEANNKTLYKNSERVVNNIPYGVEIL